MQTQTAYCNQKVIISEIHKKTGFPSHDISVILNALGNVVKEMLGHGSHGVEIKPFPGLKLSSCYLTPEQSKSNLDLKRADFVLRLDASFSDYFRKEIRRLHQGATHTLPETKTS